MHSFLSHESANVEVPGMRYGEWWETLMSPGSGHIGGQGAHSKEMLGTSEETSRITAYLGDGPRLLSLGTVTFVPNRREFLPSRANRSTRG